MKYRPKYHFLPLKGWMNDPNGPIYYNECYHLFYQHNPNDDKWGDIHWGHARSADLVQWEHLPIALAPSAQNGEVHCFSGCVVLDGETPTLFYTSVGDGERNARVGAEQCMAISNDGMASFHKPECNPIITKQIHNGVDIQEWRDPFVYHMDGVWNMLLGGGIEGHGIIARYTSGDLISWHYEGIFFNDRHYPFLECPNLLRFGKRAVLIYSAGDKAVCQVGRISENGVFITESKSFLDGHSVYYAPNTLLNDPQGRYLTWGWLREEERGELGLPGWRGVQSLPRQLELDSEGRLLQRPAKELEKLRGEKEQITRCTGSINAKTRGNSLEIQMTASLNTEDHILVNILESTDKRERTTIRFIAKTAELILEKGMTTLHNEPVKRIQNMTVPDFAGKLDLRIFIDVSVIEIFANERAVMSGRVFPSLADSKGVSFSGAEYSACIWQMKHIW